MDHVLQLRRRVYNESISPEAPSVAWFCTHLLHRNAVLPRVAIYFNRRFRPFANEYVGARGSLFAYFIHRLAYMTDITHNDCIEDDWGGRRPALQ